MADTAIELNARLIAKRTLHDSLAIFRVAFEDRSVLSFEPGQFVRVGLPREGHRGVRLVTRAYSIASAPGDAELEFFLRRVEPGMLSPELFGLEPGAPLWVDPEPGGHFTLADVPRGADVLMLATGTGLSPFLSMIRAHRGAARPWRKLVLVHGARVAADLGYGDELGGLARASQDFEYVPVLSREPADSAWTGARGHVQDVLEPGRWSGRFELDPERAQVLLCGNPAMIADVSERLQARGFRRHRRHAPGNLRSERYW